MGDCAYARPDAKLGPWDQMRFGGLAVRNPFGSNKRSRGVVRGGWDWLGEWRRTMDRPGDTVGCRDTAPSEALAAAKPCGLQFGSCCVEDQSAAEKERWKSLLPV
jgi:hypothetical protein